MSRNPSSSSSDLLDAIVRRARGKASYAQLPGTRSGLLRTYFADVPEVDLVYREPRDLAAAALSHIASGKNRPPGAAKVRIFNPSMESDGWQSDTTIVQLVNDDMPFLVDSVTMTLNRLGHRVELLIHPILGVERTAKGRLKELVPLRGNGQHSAESFIYIEISKDTDTAVSRRR
jgi:glutamate dehydrogenase